jgi:hypothetical protein
MAGREEGIMAPVSLWPDPSKPGEARFVLRDRQEEELWGRLEQSGVSADDDLTTMEAGLMEIL